MNILDFNLIEPGTLADWLESSGHDSVYAVSLRYLMNSDAIHTSGAPEIIDFINANASNIHTYLRIYSVFNSSYKDKSFGHFVVQKGIFFTTDRSIVLQFKMMFPENVSIIDHISLKSQFGVLRLFHETLYEN